MPTVMSSMMSIISFQLRILDTLMTLYSAHSLAMSRPPGTFTHSVLWQETDKPDAVGRLFIVVGFRVVVLDESLVGLSPIRFCGKKPTNLTPWVGFMALLTTPTLFISISSWSNVIDDSPVRRRGGVWSRWGNGRRFNCWPVPAARQCREFVSTPRRLDASTPCLDASTPRCLDASGVSLSALPPSAN